MGFELLYHSRDGDARCDFDQQMDVVISDVGFDDMDRRIQELRLVEAHQERLHDVWFEEFHTVFNSPDNVIFELIYAVIQAQDSHAGILAFIPAFACGVSCADKNRSRVNPEQLENIESDDVRAI